MKVTAVGFYGMHNFGDDLFRAVIKRDAMLLWPNAGARFAAPSADAPSWIRNSYADPGAAGKATRVLSALRSFANKQVSFCGGSLFQEVEGTLQIYSLGRRSGLLSLEALGVSVGPFTSVTSEAKVVEFLRSFERIVVRDAASLERLNVRGVSATLGGDLVGLLQPRLEEGGTASDGNLVIAPCSTKGAFTAEYVRNTVRIAQRWTSSVSGDVVVLALNSHPSHGDLQVSMQLSSALEEAGVHNVVHAYSEQHLEATVTTLREADLVIATRLHGGILGYLSGRPTIIVGYHDKSFEFARDVSFPADAVLEPNSSWAEWRAAFDSAVARPGLPPRAYHARAVAAYHG